jgi:molybdopterin/thiamine biosynthesis adenylyltransferase
MKSDRYSRQILFAGIGEQGQERLAKARVLIIGCVDRDFVEFSNLQRQTMFTEADAANRLPKVIAAANHIRGVNSDINVEPEIVDVNHSNIEGLIDGCDIVIDGTDNFATRYLINDACVKHNVTWIYGAAVGSYGVTMTIRPNVTPCLRCVFPEAPPAASAPTCDTAGVIMPIINVVAAVQVSEALKLLAGSEKDLHNSLMQFDVWRNEWRRISIGQPSADCPTCARREFATLAAETSDFAAVLCGRHAVQVSPPQPARINLTMLGERLAAAGEVKLNEYLLRFRTGEFEMTIFQDARSIIRGTDDVATARSLYAKFVGN